MIEQLTLIWQCSSHCTGRPANESSLMSAQSLKTWSRWLVNFTQRWPSELSDSPSRNLKMVCFNHALMNGSHSFQFSYCSEWIDQIRKLNEIERTPRLRPEINPVSIRSNNQNLEGLWNTSNTIGGSAPTQTRVMMKTGPQRHVIFPIYDC